MRILTIDGYKDIEDINIGDEVIGRNGINILDNKRIFDKEWFIEQGLEDEWKWYLINGKYQLFHNQNIFVGQGEYNLCHTFELQIGWTILNKEGVEEEIISIEEVDGDNIWWKLDISNDHSFISQDIQLHNASRYWVGGGSSANWSATGNTNWSATSGGSNNASVPTTTDDVTFNGAGTNGNTNSTISANITILSFTTTSGYTATITKNAQLTTTSNFTIDKATQWAGTSTIVMNGNATITATGFSAGDTFTNGPITFGGTNNTKTLVSSSGDFKISGLFTLAQAQVINSSGVTLTLTNGLSAAGASSGTTKIILTGGTWSGAGAISNNLDLQGNITISGSVSYSSGTLKYISGTITTTGSTITFNGSPTLDTNGITFVNVNFNSSQTLSSNLTMTGNLTTNAASTSINWNGFTVYIGGNLTMNSISVAIIGGTTNIVMNGTSPTISMTSVTSGGLRNNIEFAHSGVCTLTGGTISGTNGGFRYGSSAGTNGTMKFTSGTISISDRLVIITSASSTTNLTCNTTGITLSYVVMRSGNTSANMNINGTNGLTFSTLDLQYTGSTNTTITLKFGNTYNISTLFKTDISGLVASNQTTEYMIVSDTPGSKVVLTLSTTASQNLFHVDFTDVDASKGQRIYTFDGLDNILTLSNVSNIIKTPLEPITDIL